MTIKPEKAKKTSRSVARLYAVQALYQIESSRNIVPVVIAEFMEHRLDQAIEGESYVAADRAFFTDIVTGSSAGRAAIEDHVGGALSEDWTLARIEPVARALLCLGTYELISRPDIPTSVIINEYVDIAKAFFDDSTPGFVNGVLDRLGKNLRPS